MQYKIIQRKNTRESFGDYEYDIFYNDHYIAKYWHDFKGEEHCLEFINGFKKICPVGKLTDFISGGGSQPLTLTEDAIEYIKTKYH